MDRLHRTDFTSFAPRRTVLHQPGKFWIYERVIRPAFYGIYEVRNASVEVYHLVDGRYQRLEANERGRFPIAPLGVELGIWQGRYQNLVLPWLRWWDGEGNLLLTGAERAERAESDLERLKEQLRSAGIEPEV